jgi:hypothetical protein
VKNALSCLEPYHASLNAQKSPLMSQDENASPGTEDGDIIKNDIIFFKKSFKFFE